MHIRWIIGNCLFLALVFGCAAEKRESEMLDGGSDADSDAGHSQDAAEAGSADARDGQDAAPEDVDDAQSGDPSSEVPDAATGDNTETNTSLGVYVPDDTIPEELMLCDDGPCQCANGIDDDGDGLADGFDMECTGPNDDDEGSFATGIPGDNQDWKWQDCFFDGNSGGGDDGCKYHFECLTGDKDTDDPDCQVTQECLDFCIARTPNGCDCFGCCTIQKEDGSYISVVISEDCSEENLDDCTLCQPTDECINECGDCELCPGRTIDDLPDKCFTQNPPTSDGGVDEPDAGGSELDGGSSEPDSGTQDPPDDTPPPYTCDNGEKVCTSHGDCDSGFLCWQGCCLLAVI